MQKNCYKRLLDSTGTMFLDTLEYADECCNCISLNINSSKDYCSISCPKNKEKRLIGKKNTNMGKVYACGQNYGKSNLFQIDLDCLSASLTTLSKTKKDIDKYQQEEYATRIRRVLHNIKTINAHSLQELRNLIPESLLKQHKENSCDELESVIKKRIPATAISIFRLSRDLYEIKSEFSVYEKLIKGKDKITKRPYNIRDVIMTVLYPFFEDFKRKQVVVNVENCYESIPIDFETFQVAVYHIIENASKYIKDKTFANISFDLSREYIQIRFSMQSLFIAQNEVDTIFNEGVSGESAKQSKLSGEGIGMYRARKLIEINGGTLVVQAGKDSIMYNSINYATNVFIIQLPLI